jgi:hypothetical protein
MDRSIQRAASAESGRIKYSRYCRDMQFLIDGWSEQIYPMWFVRIAHLQKRKGDAIMIQSSGREIPIVRWGCFYGLASDILSTHAMRRRGGYAVVPIQGLVDNVAPGTERCRVMPSFFEKHMQEHGMCIPDGSGVKDLPVSSGAVRGAGLCGSTGWRYPRLSGGFGRGAARSPSCDPARNGLAD